MALVGEKWMRWTLLEASTKTLSKLLQKVVGMVSLTLAHTFLATFVIGLVQALAGFIVVKANKKSFFPDALSVFGSCLFGLFAVVSTVLVFIVFLSGGDVGINVFIITLGIVPGALIDRFFFGHFLNFRQWLGIFVAILAGYSVLGWPSLEKFIAMPLWVWLSFCVTMTVTINQAITQKIRKIDPFVKNFWGGMVAVILGSLGAVALSGSGEILINFSPAAKNLWLVSVIMGILIVGMWSFNLLSYREGAFIVLKKLVMNGVYLSSSMVAGVIVFGEELTLAKMIGVFLFVMAFALMDKNAWEFIRSRFDQ